MNLLILSDLHIGNGDPFGTFGWSQEEFMIVLDQIVDEYSIDQVVLNGDIFELYKYPLVQIREANGKLINYLESSGFLFIKGNHDILHPAGEDFFLTENSSGQKIYIEHGHEADFMNGTKLGRWMGRRLFSMIKRLASFDFFLKQYFRFVEYDDQIKRIPKKYNTYKYLQYALKLLRTYDVVILGHTHKIETHHTYYLQKKKRYLNCGTCSMGRFEGIVLDTESLRYEIIKTSRKAFRHFFQPSLYSYSIPG
ncbi:MAG: metallophosphoesterase [Bacteroidales bacterium]